MTDAAAWPAPIHLPGQAAAPEGPVDVNTMYVLHHGFRRDLTNFVEAAPRTPVEDRAAWGALAARWKVFATELHRHHEHEDRTLWPMLLDGVDDQGREVLQEMQREHAGIDPILEACAQGFDRLAVAADPEARDALVAQLVAGRDNLDGHLAHEERAAIPLIQSTLTQADWGRFEAAARKDSGFSALFTMVPWAAYGLDDQVRDDLFAASPAVMRLVWRLTHRRFDDRERRAFRYAE